MTVKFTEVFKGLIYFMLLVPAVLWAIEFSMPKDVTEEELTNVPEEKAEYGDSKRQRKIEGGVPAGESEEASQPLVTEPVTKGETLEDDAVEAVETTGAGEAADFMEFPLEEPETEPEAQEFAEGQGGVTGQVFDKETGAPIRGVAIAIEGTELGTITDESGNFKLDAVPAGSYTLACLKTGYLTANITDVAVEPGEFKTLDFALPPRPAETSNDVYDLGTITVTAEEANDMMMNLELITNSNSILSVMSSEDFSKYASSDIGDAVKRVSGVSVVGGKYVVIRGLGDRYVWTTMNGLPIASPDPDKLAVQLDLFPSSLFESIEVRKTFTPDQSATATGSLDLKLKGLPDEFFMDISASVGYHSIATGNDNFLVNDRETHRDQFAMGADSRGLPESAKEFPEDLNKPVNTLPFPIPGTITQAEKDAAVAEALAITDSIGRDFHNYGEAPGPDYGVRFSFGNAYDVKDNVRVGFIGGLNYDREFRMIEDAGYFRSTTEISGANTLSPENFIDPDVAIGYRNQKRTESTSINVLSWLVGLGLELGENHSFSLSRLDLRQSEDENTRLSGDVFNRFPFSSDSDFLDTEIAESLKYTERRLVSDQLSGNHSFELPADVVFGEIELDWAIGQETATQEEPGYVQTRAIVLDSGDLTLSQDSTSPNTAFPSFVIWRDIKEERDSQRLDLDFNETFADGFSSKIKLGFLTSEGERSVFDEYISLLGDDLSTPTDTTVDQSDDSGAPLSNFDSLDASGYEVAADINLETKQSGYYLMLKQKLFEDFTIIGGYRYEKNTADVRVNGVPKLRGAGANNPLSSLPAEGGYDEGDWFPGLTVTYKPIDNLSFKAAYSKTLALPSAREVSPYASSAFSGSDIDIGNSSLAPSRVENFDLGFSWFNQNSDSVSITLFYKKVEERIERLNGNGITLTGSDPFDLDSYSYLTFSENLNASLFSWYNNPSEATLAGIELEGRKSLGFFSDSLVDFSIGGNFTYIDGEVDRFPIEIAAKNAVGRPISESRTLTNQPEYIINGDITYDNSELGVQVSLIVYHISEVLDGVSLVDSYDVYAKAYSALDLTASKTFGESFKISVSVKNLTNSERGTYYDVEGNEVDRDSYKIGRSTSLSASYEF